MIRTIKDKPNQSAIDLLSESLDKAKSGELTGITIMSEFKGGTYSLGGSSTMSRLQTAGILLEAAISRLMKEE